MKRHRYPFYGTAGAPRACRHVALATNAQLLGNIAHVRNVHRDGSTEKIDAHLCPRCMGRTVKLLRKILDDEE